MKVLIVEDDLNKAQQIVSLVREVVPDPEIESRHSFTSGLKAVMSFAPDLVLLDMTIPTYDVAPNEFGGRTRPLGGRQILRQIERRRMSCKVVVVTQFESFGEGGETTTLQELMEELKSRFPSNYVGSVFYRASGTEWRQKLSSYLALIIKGRIE